MKFTAVVGLFLTSVCFAGTLNCKTKEDPRNAKAQTQQSSVSFVDDAKSPDYDGGQSYLKIASIADPQITFEALGDATDGIWVSVHDARSGIDAENRGAAVGTSTELTIPQIGSYTIYCTISK